MGGLVSVRTGTGNGSITLRGSVVANGGSAADDADDTNGAAGGRVELRCANLAGGILMHPDAVLQLDGGNSGGPTNAPRGGAGGIVHLRTTGGNAATGTWGGAIDLRGSIVARGGTPLVISAATSTERTGLTLAALLDTLARLASEAPSQRELRTAREQLRTSALLALQTSSGTAELLLENQLWGLPGSALDELRRRLEQLKARDVQSSARRYLQAPPVVVVVPPPAAPPASVPPRRRSKVRRSSVEPGLIPSASRRAGRRHVAQRSSSVASVALVQGRPRT